MELNDQCNGCEDLFCSTLTCQPRQQEPKTTTINVTDATLAVKHQFHYDAKLILKPISEHYFRANWYDYTTNNVAKSLFLRIEKTADGYIIEDKTT